MFLMFTGVYWVKLITFTARMAAFGDRIRCTACHPLATHGNFTAGQPPAKGGSTSITAPSSSTIDSLAARPTGSAFTRKDDLAMTTANRVSGFLLATAVLIASRSVVASTDSSGRPAASF